MKDHAKTSTIVRKSNTRTYTPPEQVKVEPNISIVKDLLSDNIDGHVIQFEGETARIAKPYAKDKHREEELPSKDEIIGLASIAVPPSDPLEQYC